MAGGEGLTATTTQPKLSKQDLSTLDVTKLTPLSPEVISNQATINIGTIGHVAHGKSTVVKALSGVQTVRFKNELERNITIKLGKQERTASADKAQTPEEGDVAMPSDGPPTETAGARGFAECRKEMEEEESLQKNVCSRKSKRRRAETSSSSKKQDEYEVEKILDYEYDGQHWYRIKWKGWKHEYNTWEPLDNLLNSKKLVDEFHKRAEEEERREEAKRRKLEAHAANVEMILSQCAEILYPKEELEKFLKKLGKFPELPSQKDLERCALLIQHRQNDLSYKPRNKTLGCWAIAKTRERQLRELEGWERDMNEQCTDPAPITVVNEVDLEGPPKNFNYINRYLASSSISIPTEPPVGCDCGTVCDLHRKGCCADQAGATFAYTANKRLRIKQGLPIYECNARCSCLENCPNRVVQLGRQYPLCIFRTSTGCGWGVRSVKKIPKGSFICEYVGEVITNEEAEKRGREYDAQGRTYLFDLDYNQTELFDCMYTVDAAVNGNLSHFINHSCDPNLEVFAVWIDCLDPNLPRLALFACKDINAGDEVTFDYTPHHVHGPIGHPSPSRHARKLSLNNNGLRTQCKCGSAKCRKEFF